MKRLFGLFLLASLVLLTASFTFAQSNQVREFSPVQDGFQPNGKLIPIYAPNRIIVKFTADAMLKGMSEIPLEKGALVPNAQTGLPSLDALLAGISADRIERLQGELKNTTEAHRLRAYDWFIITVPHGTDIEDAANRLANDPNVEFAGGDRTAFPTAIPNDAYYSANWGHNNTAQMPSYNWAAGNYSGPLVGTVGFDSNAQTAWNGSQGYGYNSVIIAILDTGVDLYHPDLNLVPGYDYGDGDNNPHDDSFGGYAGHGTACAGVAAAIANNSLGVAGIAGGCSIMPLKVADSAGNLFLSYVVNAVYHAADNGADVASMSFSFLANDPALDIALEYAYNNGVTLLAATGNENDSTITYPANNQYVIAVGAASPCGGRKRSSSNSGELDPYVFPDPNGYTCDGERWWGSNYCSVMQNDPAAVDIIAPTILPTTDLTGSGGYSSGSYFSYFSGTSCSTPYAAGVAALIKSAYPSWSPGSIRSQLTNNAQDIVNIESVPGWDVYSGYGMVDAHTAVTGGNIPTAAFTSSAAFGCIGQSINFTNNSVGGSIFSSLWTFGDGGSSTSNNPSYIYNTPGIYTVSLTVSGPYGSNTLTMVNMITVGQPPTADFSATPVSGQIPLAVNFTDLSTGDPLGWFWDFGDGTPIDHSQHPVHIFPNPGSYTITLTVGNNCGPSTPMIKHNYIQATPPPPPVASFTTSDTVSCGPLMVNFTDTSTGTIGQWDWDFGNGQMSSEQNPMHMFDPMPDPYTVTLTVTGPGGQDTLVKQNHILVLDLPFAHFSMSDTTGIAPLTVDFTDLSGMPESWAWDFGGDGTSSETNPSHTFNNAGTYQVLLTVSNMCGVDTTSLNVVVTNPAAPVANFTANTTSGCKPLAVAFTDSSTGTITSWSWNFGDGTTSTAQNPNHTYTSEGLYDVSLQVTGPGGNHTKTVTGMITVTGPPTAAFSVSDTLLTGPFDVTFTDLSTGSPVSWLWNFGDSVTDTLQNPVHTYTADGTYTVTLVATNACGSNTLVETNLITIQSSSGAGDVVAARFELAQNYPNPFNPMTTIVFNLAKEGHARLDIFDATGRRVETLVDGPMNAGEHQLPWQPVKLSSGIYFARFSANGQTATKRMVLLR